MAALLHGQLYLSLDSASDLTASSSSKIYATVSLGHRRLIKTEVMKLRDRRLVWNIRSWLDVNDEINTVDIFLKSVSRMRSAPSTEAMLFMSARELVLHGTISGTFKLTIGPPSDSKPAGNIQLSMSYVSVISTKHGFEVPRSYFPLRSGCKLTLYQDAHVLNDELVQIRNGFNQCRQHRRTFEEISAAIKEAKHFVYITGWSVYSQLRLLRENADKELHLGDLLLQKSREGCHVVIMIWDDFTNNNMIMKEGIMATYDENTVRFFAGSKVKVAKVPRLDDGTNGVFGGLTVSSVFTHHQKSVLVDRAVPGRPHQRRLVAFVGGLDLTTGRWDTPSHNLWKTLQTLHKGDFRQACMSADSVNGPREPWHDLHSCLEGDAAYDVYKNFEERCMRQGEEYLPLCDLRRPPFIRREEERQLIDRDPEGWRVQVFRSIDERSACLDKRLDALVLKKGRLVDTSIQNAFVYQIRRAERFIYIENQYFLGSSHAWQSDANKKCTNIVPLELTRKIISMIRMRRAFTIYVIIPMYPEGPPESDAVQEILHYQHSTIDMMYRKIDAALREAKMQNERKPTDYLSFFCLGRKEFPDGKQPLPEVFLGPSFTMNAQKNRRFMIYVHSKMMIVDDEYIILGSANINERSMAGTRDTEIAIGAHQPTHTTAKLRHFNQVPQGDVHCYRRSLWSEHFGDGASTFTEPESIQCMRKIRAIASENWQKYVDVSYRQSVCGALLYPYHVGEFGVVTSSISHFPDTTGSVLGRQTKLPQLMTT
mmetsp:Transcript_10866/g.33312  ORF Transcript_10866/g.33312 Transcript_10866/m.33312 type:complete len:766 (+) Transcript_10866:183-2480(+)